MAASASGPVRVLMSEGSSLSARESLTGLGRAGFHVEAVDGNPLCLARFSKFCRRLHAAPVSASIRAAISNASSSSSPAGASTFSIRRTSRRSCSRAFAMRCRRTSLSLCPTSRTSCGCRARSASPRCSTSSACRRRRRRSPTTKTEFGGRRPPCRSTSRRPSARQPGRAFRPFGRPARAGGRSAATDA